MTAFTDIHCHILPGIDDGPSSPAEARILLDACRCGHVENLVFTPHFYPERIPVEEFIGNRDAAVGRIRQDAEALGICYRVGAEIAYTPRLAEMPLEQLAFSGIPYLLLELPPDYQPPDVEGLIHRLVQAGYTPILAHIERFRYIEEDPTLLYRWVQAGALGQINAEWVQRDRRSRKRAAQYFQWNLIHLMGSDAHSPDRRPPDLEQGMNCLPEAMRSALQNNAECVFRGDILQRPEPSLPRRFLGKWR